MATQAAVFHQELSQCILHKSMLCIQHSLSGRQHGALCWHKPSRLSPAQPPRMPGFLLLLCGSLLSLLSGSSYKNDPAIRLQWKAMLPCLAVLVRQGVTSSPTPPPRHAASPAQAGSSLHMHNIHLSAPQP